MPRNYSSKSRSRSPKRTKRNHHDSSDSERDDRRRSKHRRTHHESPIKNPYNFRAKSDIKYHIRYDDIRIRRREDKDLILREV